MALIAEVVSSNYLNEGDVTARFERAIADRVGARHAIATTSGTTALFLALVGVGVRPGDEVIVPDLTFIATANAVRLAGAEPVLVDVDRRTLTIDPTAVSGAITPRTKAVVPVHVSGRAADMTRLGDLALRAGIAVVEDAAEAFMSRAGRRALGTIGAAGCLSFSPNKTITTGQGGMILTDDDDLALRLRAMKDQGRPTRGTGGDDAHPTLGFNFKFTNLQAAVGLAQLDRLEERLARQRRIFDIYETGLRDLADVTLPGFALAAGECPLWTDSLVDQRETLEQRLTQRRIGFRRFWLPIHTQPPYLRDGKDFENANWCSARAMWLPSAFTLTDDDVRSVVSVIREAFTK